jgi:aspartate aminotransferase-like enzyme
MLDEEGMHEVFARHARAATRAREGVKSLGLELFPADERYASNTVTAVTLPPEVDGGKLLKVLREKHGVVLSGGQASLTGKIFRIGHLGMVDVGDMDQVILAIERALPEAR